MTNLLPCPFCGSTDIDAAGWASIDRSGPACDDCGASADTVEIWNSRPQLENAKGYVDRAIASYVGDPADNQFQKGYLAALEVVRNEAFALSVSSPVDKGA